MSYVLLLSIVRQKLLTQPGYVPYCGADGCSLRWPRTTFNGSQFQCACGWRSRFESEFIDQYKATKSSEANGKGTVT